MIGKLILIHTSFVDINFSKGKAFQLDGLENRMTSTKRAKKCLQI
jgi:hypothetical protein